MSLVSEVGQRQLLSRFFTISSIQPQEMNRIVALLCLCAVSWASAASDTNSDRVSSDAVPLASSVSEFKDLQSEVAQTPQGGAVMFVQALMAYARGYDECVPVGLTTFHLSSTSF